MKPKVFLVLGLGCTGQAPTLIDSASNDAAMCSYDVSFYCDYRTTAVHATCTEYSQQAFDYLDTTSRENSDRTLQESCENNGATWGEGACPRDDSWVGACVGEVGGTIGLVYATHYYSEPETIRPDGTTGAYDDATASQVCLQSSGSEWCNDGSNE